RVDTVIITLVSQVLDIDAQGNVFGDVRRSRGVKAPVAGYRTRSDTDWRLGEVAVLPRIIDRAAADLVAVRDINGRPEGEAMLRRIGERLAVIDIALTCIAHFR